MAALSWLHPRARRIAGSAKRRIVRIVRGWQILSLYVYELTYAEASTVARPDVEVAIKELMETDDSKLLTVAGFGFYGQSKEQLVEFLRAGQRCYIAEHEGQPIAYHWCLTGTYYDPFMKRWLRFARDQEYRFGAYIAPAFRGVGIMPYLDQISAEERNRCQSHPKKAISFVRTSNKAQQRNSEKLGFIRTGRIGFIECMGIRWNFLIGRGVLPETKKRNFISAPGWK